MRAAKILFGIVSLLTVRYVGLSLCVVCWEVASRFAATWAFGFIAAVVSAIGLGISGIYLITKSHTPVSKMVVSFIAYLWVTTAVVMSFGLHACELLHTTSQKNACINNLRQIDGAKQEWGLRNNAVSNSIPTWNNIVRYLGRGDGKIPKCPSGGIYTIGRLDEEPRCSIGPPHLCVR